VEAFVMGQGGEEEGGEEVFRARGDVLVLLSDLGRPLAGQAVGGLVEFNRAAEVLKGVFGMRVERADLATREARLSVLHKLVGAGRVQGAEGVAAVVSLLHMWEGRPAEGKGEVGLEENWDGYVQRGLRGGEGDKAEEKGYGQGWRTLLTGVLATGSMELAGKLVLFGGWREEEGLEGEEAVLREVEAGRGDEMGKMQVKLKVRTILRTL
jgi:hypothetical protein